MDGIADVLALNGIGGIAAVLRLVAQARHPDDVVRPVVADHVHHALEEGGQALKLRHRGAAHRSVRAHDVDRLVGQLEHHAPIAFQLGMARHDVPHRDEEGVVVIAHGNLFRTDSGRAQHHVQPFSVGIFHHGNEHLVQVLAEAGGREAFVAFVANGLLIGIVAPVGIHVHADVVHPPAGPLHAVNLPLVPGQTGSHVVVVPSVLVEEGTEGHAVAVEVHHLARIVAQVPPAHVQPRHGLHQRLFRFRIGRRLFRCGVFRRLHHRVVRTAHHKQGAHQHPQISP